MIVLSDFCVVGHLTIDEIVRGENFKRTVGGTAYYSSVTAKVLGWSSRLISKVGFDFPSEYLESIRSFGIDVSRVFIEDFPSTSFLLKYNGDRILRLMGRCVDIYVDDVYNAIDENTIVHIGPVAGEVSMDVVKYIYGNSKLVSADLQGFLRFFDSMGFVKLVKPIFLDELFEHIDILHCDIEEAYVSTGIKDPFKAAKHISNKYDLIVLLTMGKDGMYLAYDNSIFHIPSNVQSVIEETGAGDICTSAFLYMYNLTGDPLTSALFSSSTTSIYIESGNIVELKDRAKVNAKINLIKDSMKIF